MYNVVSGPNYVLVKMVTQKSTRNVKGILERQWSRKESDVMKWKLKDLRYLGDKKSAGGGCEAALTARTRCG